MRAYFEQRYSPGNIVLVAAGNVDFPQLVESARRCCGHWPPAETTRQATPPEPHHQFLLFTKQNALQQYATQISAGPAADDPHRFATRVLATVLGDDSGSRLFWALVDSGLAEYAAMSAYEFQGCGIVMTFLCCAPDDVGSNLQTIRDLQLDAARQGITQDELDLAKAKICSEAVLRSERPQNRMFSLGNNWIQRRTYQTVRQTVDAYQAVSRDQVMRMLELYPLEQNATVITGPLTELKRTN
jgi:predicted Zn-dependent peptidase